MAGMIKKKYRDSLEKNAGTAGSITRNCRGSFANKPDEGILAILDRWIESGWPRLERRGERESSTGEENRRGGAPLPTARSSPERLVWVLEATV